MSFNQLYTELNLSMRSIPNISPQTMGEDPTSSSHLGRTYVHLSTKIEQTPNKRSKSSLGRLLHAFHITIEGGKFDPDNLIRTKKHFSTILAITNKQSLYQKIKQCFYNAFSGYGLKSSSKLLEQEIKFINSCMLETNNAKNINKAILKLALKEGSEYSTKGLFRHAGSISMLDRLQQDTSAWSDKSITSHDLASLIKREFRDMNARSPFFTSDRSIQDQVPELSSERKKNFETFTRLLLAVSENKDVNKMTIDNLAVCIAPNFFSSELHADANPSSALVEMKKQQTLFRAYLETLL